MTLMKSILARSAPLYRHQLEPHIIDELAQRSESLPPYDQREKLKKYASDNDEDTQIAIESMDEDDYFSLQLEVSLLQYVTGYPKPLLTLYKGNPDLFQKIDKGPDQPLYRGINISKEQLQKLKDGKGIPCGKDLITSWSLEFKGAKDVVMNVQHNPKADFQIIFKKDIEPEDRLACITCNDLPILDTHEDEQEVLCKNVIVTKEDIFKLYQKKKEVPL